MEKLSRFSYRLLQIQVLIHYAFVMYVFWFWFSGIILPLPNITLNFVCRIWMQFQYDGCWWKRICCFVKEIFGSNNIQISFDHTSVLKSVHFVKYCIVYEMLSCISCIRISPHLRKKKIQPQKYFCMKICTYSTFFYKGDFSSPKIHRETIPSAALLIFLLYALSSLGFF